MQCGSEVGTTRCCCTPSPTSSYVVTSESGTAALASELSRLLQPGDVYLLYGAVGAGKSAFRWAVQAGPVAGGGV